MQAGLEAKGGSDPLVDGVYLINCSGECIWLPGIFSRVKAVSIEFTNTHKQSMKANLFKIVSLIQVSDKKNT